MMVSLLVLDNGVWCPKIIRQHTLRRVRVRVGVGVGVGVGVRNRNGNYGCRLDSSSLNCFAAANSNNVVPAEEDIRPPFDINLAVILAGFSFEAYTSPPESNGKLEVDAAGCKTIFLSESFLREIYSGHLIIKLKKGFKFPALDPWGTSDPYVVMQLDGQVAQTSIKWATREPTWNQEFTFNLMHPTTQFLQVAAWDANLVTPHKRMGNAGISLEELCDGNLHKLLLELEGIGGGGKVELEVKYKSFEEVDEEKNIWRIPFISEFLKSNGFDSMIKKLIGSDKVPARQFVEYAFEQLKAFSDVSSKDNQLLKDNEVDTKNAEECGNNGLENVPLESRSCIDGDNPENESSTEFVSQVDDSMLSHKHFWKNFAQTVDYNFVQKLGLPFPEKFKWDGFDFLNKVGLQARKVAEIGYVESGLATADSEDYKIDGNSSQSSIPDIKKATQDLLQQTDSVLGALMVMTAAVSQLNKDTLFTGKKSKAEDDEDDDDVNRSEKPTETIDGKKADEMKALFSSAETAMEAWAMLATSIGHSSFIKSEFEKICFLDNETTDTQVAIWRDSARKRLVVAFRGTEQTRWKDLITDLMILPAGLNPERIGGDFKQEVQVHSGFLIAYDSVRIRILSLLKSSIGYMDDDIAEPQQKWHVYVTGHSLGGALATLLALELASSQLSKHGAISLTMYNFGSPRVGNKNFAEIYNEKVIDSWRVVNHRDIIPTIPRLMGYCHVAQPLYLAPGDLKETSENMEIQKDGYEGDVIGEATPDVIVSEFMKGEKELIEKILLTEINIFRAIRDGSALMQHMEDFYYITLLETVRSNYQTTVPRSEKAEGGSTSI